MSGQQLGQPKKDNEVDKRTEYNDNYDRIQVKRDFSLAKRCPRPGLILAKLETTTLITVALAIVTLNLGKIQSNKMFGISLKYYKYLKGDK